MENRMEYIEELMVARLTGNIEQKDSEFLDEMIEADPEVAALWREHQLVHAQVKPGAINKERLWAQVQADIHAHEAQKNINKKRKVPLLAFASILVILAAGALYFITNKPGTENLTGPAPVLTAANTIRFSNGAESVNIDRNAKGVTQMNAAEVMSENGVLQFKPKSATDNSISTLEVPQGLDRQVRLSDGTMVWVNAETKLSFPLNFTGSTREVTLDGEAYFEVAKHAKKFIVHSNQMDVEVTGTHFNIRAYPNEPVQTSLTEGSVTATAKGQQIKLTPGKAAVLDNNKFNATEFDESIVLGWMHGSYMFYNETFESISRTVDRWFGYSFAYASPGIENSRFSGNLEKSQTLEQFLDNISSSANLTYTIQNRLVTLQRKPK